MEGSVAGNLAGAGAGASDLRGLYRTTLPEVYGYLLAHTGGNTSLAEDLTSETFVHAAAHYGKGRADEVTVGWLITVAKRRLVDSIRREERLRRRADRLRQEMHVDSQDSVTSNDDAVYEALSSLLPEHRLVLVLKHLDGLSVQEIATTIGRSHKGAEALLTRARTQFREVYRGAEDA